jgi:hypothetical protein
MKPESPEEPKHQVLLAGTARFSTKFFNAEMALRVNFAVKHLLGAARFSRQVGTIERENSGKPLAEWWEDMSDNAVACIFLASAALEAYANELFADREKVFTPGTITKDALLFPRAWVSHSCTKWAVNTTVAFLEEFEHLADLVGRTDRTKFAGQLEP